MGDEIINAQLTPLGQRCIDLAALLPLGAPLQRPSFVAGVCLAVVLVVLARLVYRRERSWPTAIGCAAVAILLIPLAFRQIALLAASVATLLGSLSLQPLWPRPSTRQVLLVVALAALAALTAPLATAFACLVSVGAVWLARGLRALPVGAASRAFLLAGATFVLVMTLVNAPSVDTWRLEVWRDAVEGTLPAGTEIATSKRTLASLNNLLLWKRPTNIALRYADDGNHEFVLEDLHSPAAEADAQRVRLTLPSPTAVLRYAPAGTLAAVALSGRVREQSPDAAALLQQIGRVANAKSRAVVTMGATGVLPSQSIETSESPLQVLLGDVIAGTSQRSPTDVELAANDTAVSVRLRGREVVHGAAWAVLLLSPQGRLLQLYSGPSPDLTVAVHVPGLQVWRVPRAGAPP